MADADEDLFPSHDPDRATRASNGQEGGSDSDGDSDVAPDYGLLPGSSKKNSLPKRGVKDFEPVSTDRQASSLEDSRTKMYDALSVIRIHNNRDLENVGVYFSDSVDWDGARYEEAALGKVDDLEKRQKIKESSALTAGEGRCVAVPKMTTTFSRTMGQMDRRNWLWLLPEEALFLLERGTLDIRYAGTTGSGNDNDEPESSTTAPSSVLQPQLPIGDVPMSLQGAYAAFLGKSGLSLERYLVYSNLRRGGYIVSRALTWSGSVERHVSTASHIEIPENTQAQQLVKPSDTPALVHRLISWLFPSTPKPQAVSCYNSATGPLIYPGLFRSYGDVYRQLHLILTRTAQNEAIVDRGCSTTTSSATEELEAGQQPEYNRAAPQLLPCWTLHKPSALQNYKKSAPPPPHYTIVVLDARHSFVPTSKQIGDLLALMPEDLLPNAPTKRLENRIKHGKRNIMLAVVDSGLISYMRFSSDGFGSDNILWEENERRGQRAGSKRGGGFRGRGRGGRGRGRGR